jgi:hypothetical protein
VRGEVLRQQYAAFCGAWDDFADAGNRLASAMVDIDITTELVCNGKRRRLMTCPDTVGLSHCALLAKQ